MSVTSAVLGGDDGALRQQVLAAVQAQQWPQAWECLQVLGALHPQDAWVQQWQVVGALAMGKPVDAVSAAQAALALLPETAVRERVDVLFNLAQAYGRLGEHANAHQALAKLVQLAPQHLQGLGDLANSLVKAGAIAQGLAHFLRYEQLKPTSPYTACMVVFLMRQLAQWQWPQLPVNLHEGPLLAQAQQRGESPALALLAHRAWQNMPAIEPFAGLVLYDDPALQRHVAEQLLKHLHPPVPVLGSAGEAAAPALPVPERKGTAKGKGSSRKRKRLLRVAYISCEFMEHATSYLLASVLARHDPARVQVFLLSFAPQRQGGPDAMQQRIAAMGHAWVDIHTWGDAQVAQWCREQGMDVAVDLKSLTRPKWRMRGQLGFQGADWQSQLLLNYLGAYDGGPVSLVTADTGRSIILTNFRVPAWWTLDWTAIYQWSRQTTLRVGVENVFNRNAPLDLSWSTSFNFGTNPVLGNVWGRTVSLAFTYRF